MNQCLTFAGIRDEVDVRYLHTKIYFECNMYLLVRKIALFYGLYIVYLYNIFVDFVCEGEVKAGVYI